MVIGRLDGSERGIGSRDGSVVPLLARGGIHRLTSLNVSRALTRKRGGPRGARMRRGEHWGRRVGSRDVSECASLGSAGIVFCIVSCDHHLNVIKASPFPFRFPDPALSLKPPPVPTLALTARLS